MLPHTSDNIKRSRYMKFLLKLFGFEAKKVVCKNCNHRWTAVYPKGREKHQNCPKCGKVDWCEVKK